MALLQAHRAEDIAVSSQRCQRATLSWERAKRRHCAYLPVRSMLWDGRAAIVASYQLCRVSVQMNVCEDEGAAKRQD